MSKKEISDWIKENSSMLNNVLNCVKVGIYITDGEGNTIFLNDESCKTGGLDRDGVLGRNMRELAAIGYVQESATLKVLNSGQEENFVQNLGDGGEIFITGTPFYSEGKIKLVVCTERDVTEAMTLRALLKEKEEIAEKYETEIEYLKRHNIVMNGDIISKSHKMKAVADEALKVAALDTTVLLTGESGTGKELFANLIYEKSRRAGGPFIKVNCAAIPENLMETEFFGYEKGAFTGAEAGGKIGFFELAHGGTLFLDEIGDLPIHMQSKMLRAIQEKEIIRVGGMEAIPVDIRIIAATNVDLWKAVSEGKFRRDLYYRLNVIPICIPPLRERMDDIGELAIYFTGKYSKEYKIEKEIEQDAIEALMDYNWPGNVRELKNVIERLVVSFKGNKIKKFQIYQLLHGGIRATEAFHTGSGMTLKELMDNFEKQVLETMMEEHKKAAKVARILDVNKSTLSRRLQKYGIE